MNRLCGLLLVLFAVLIAICAIASGSAGVFLLFSDNGGPAIFPLVGSFLLFLGTLYFLILGVYGLFRGLPEDALDDELPSKGDRVFGAVVGGCAGILFGTVGGILFMLSGDWESAVTVFGNAILVLSLICWAFPGYCLDLTEWIYRPAFRFAFWILGRFW